MSDLLSKSTNRLDISTLGLLNIALPISIGTFVQFLVLLTDNFFLARVSESAINGAGNAGLIYLTFGMLIFGSATGIQILVARRHGEGNDALQIRTGRMGLVIHSILAVALVATVLFLNQGFLGRLISSDIVRDVFEPFLTTRTWGFLPFGITFAITAYWTGLARTKLLLIVSLTTALTNLLLDYAWIDGNLGFSAMGYIGAARASLTAEITGFLVAVLVMLKVEPRFFKLPKRPDGVVIKAWWAISGPLMGQLLLTVGTWTSFFFFVEKVGSTELKISHIGRNAFMLAFVISSGISQTTRTVVSQLIGASRTSDLTPALKRLALINIVGVIIMSHGFILYPESLARFFFEDPQSIASMSRTFSTLFIAVIGFSISTLFLSTLEGAGGTKRAFLVEMIGAGCYLATAFYLTSPIPPISTNDPSLVQYFPIEIIWRVEWVYFTLIGLGSLLMLRNGKWRKGLESLS
jgi:putative MATE family efflux protein